jgi:hypothetical protein
MRIVVGSIANPRDTIIQGKTAGKDKQMKQEDDQPCHREGRCGSPALLQIDSNRPVRKQHVNDMRDTQNKHKHKHKHKTQTQTLPLPKAAAPERPNLIFEKRC